MVLVATLVMMMLCDDDIGLDMNVGVEDDSTFSAEEFNVKV